MLYIYIYICTYIRMTSRSVWQMSSLVCENEMLLGAARCCSLVLLRCRRIYLYSRHRGIHTHTQSRQHHHHHHRHRHNQIHTTHRKPPILVLLPCCVSLYMRYHTPQACSHPTHILEFRIEARKRIWRAQHRRRDSFIQNTHT